MSITHLFRDIAGWQAGADLSCRTRYLFDPRHGGGKINACTTEDLVSLIEIGGEDYLMYKTFPVNVGIIRGTTADLDGNVTMEKSITLEALAIAMAACTIPVERSSYRSSGWPSVAPSIQDR